MNAFTWLMLAFPFYLAINGKLAGYISLAEKAQAQPGNVPASGTV